MQGRVAALHNPFDYAGATTESHTEKDVLVHEQILFNDDELRPAEPCAEVRADILRARG